MKFGGADPAFVKEFTWCNYIIKYYTIGICGLCGQPVKVWVDKCIVMGEPKFDKDMANQDSQADSANPNELSQRFTNQSTSGAQTMSVQVPQGLQGGMPMQVQTAGGVMQVLIPAGQQPGTAFEIQVPKSNDPSLPIATSKVDTKAEEKAAAAAAQARAQARGQEEATLAATIAASLAPPPPAATPAPSTVRTAADQPPRSHTPLPCCHTPLAAPHTLDRAPHPFLAGAERTC